MSIDGRALAGEILARTKVRAAALARRPKVVAYVAQDPTPATRSYLKIKAKSAERAGCDFEETQTPAFFEGADAAIVQLPTTPVAMALLDVIPLEKDADVLSHAAREKFEKGDTDALLPPVVAAIREILTKNNVTVQGKKVVVIGTGWLVGAPAAIWLTQQGAEVRVATKTSGDLHELLVNADIIVSGAGSPYLITPEMITEGAVIIDAGTSESDGTLKGDADPACAAKCSVFTPVPGGVGPIAVACLFENAVTLAERAIHS